MQDNPIIFSFKLPDSNNIDISCDKQLELEDIMFTALQIK